MSVSLAGSWSVVEIVRADGFTATDIRPLVRLNVSVILEENGRRETGVFGIGGRYLYDEVMAPAIWNRAIDEALADWLTPFLFPVTREEERIWIRSDRAVARACAERASPILDHMSTANVARDLDLLRRAVGEAVDFKVKLKRGGAPANVDPAQFEAALLNLIVNARDALGDVTGAKGRQARITVQTRACTVEAGQIAELAAGDYVCVSVADNGEGMSPDIRDRVYEPFFTTKGVGKGTGLGLDISRRIVTDRHGGEISVDSEPGCTVISVRLPQRPPAG